MRRVIFLVRAGLENLGSSVLRGNQLMEICRGSRLSERFAFSVGNGREDMRQAILFLTKGFANTTDQDYLARQRGAGNVILLDFLDAPVKPTIMSFCDVLVSSSRQQDAHYRTTYDVATGHVTHHVDRRIPPVALAAAGFRCGYFGNIHNTHLPPALGRQIDVHKAADPRETSWIAHLADYTCHWAVRRHQGFDGFKPFTKGFIASACGAGVIVSDQDGEAACYLGSDYPYRADVSDPARLAATMEQAREDFGGVTWQQALTTMARVRQQCSDAHIVNEMAALLALCG